MLLFSCTVSKGQVMGIKYEYKDEILVVVFDTEDISTIWKGYKKHLQDYIVTDTTRKIHVCTK